MLEKFSASAIQALNAAREEALRLEFSQVDTDHLLLGLAHERQGLAARTLRKLGVEQRPLRLAVEQRSGRGYMQVRQEDLVFAPGTLRTLGRAADRNAVLVESQDVFLALLEERESAAEGVFTDLKLDLGELGRTAQALVLGPEPAPEEPVVPTRFNPRLLTPTAQSVVSYAYAATRFGGHTLVGTEQLLLGLLYVRMGLAAKVLVANGMDPLEVEAVASRVIGHGSGTVQGRLSLTNFCEEVFEKAWEEARRLKHAQVGTGHVLLGLIQLDVGGALYIMDHLSLDLAQLRLDVEQAFAAAPGDPEPDSVSEGGTFMLDDDMPIALVEEQGL